MIRNNFLRRIIIVLFAPFLFLLAIVESILNGIWAGIKQTWSIGRGHWRSLECWHFLKTSWLSEEDQKAFYEAEREARIQELFHGRKSR